MKMVWYSAFTPDLIQKLAKIDLAMKEKQNTAKEQKKAVDDHTEVIEQFLVFQSMILGQNVGEDSQKEEVARLEAELAATNAKADDFKEKYDAVTAEQKRIAKEKRREEHLAKVKAALDRQAAEQIAEAAAAYDDASSDEDEE